MPIAEARRMLKEGKTLEDVWRLLRDAGFDMIDSKQFTMSITGMSSPEAQRALYESETWADMRPIVDQLEDDIIEAALSMGAEVRIDGRLITDKSQM
ncbi:MAG: hypothetical protein M3Q10_09955 [Chloroflexota bacterium]|nr:hypothetical protein [Chloroflexota bacterium]